MKHVSLNRFFVTACLLFGLTAMMLPINHVLMPDVNAKSQYQGSPKLPLNNFSRSTESIHNGSNDARLTPTPLNDGTPNQTGEAMPPQPLVEMPQAVAENTTSENEVETETSDDQPVNTHVETAQKTDVNQTNPVKTEQPVAHVETVVKPEVVTATAKTVVNKSATVPTETTIMTEPLAKKEALKSSSQSPVATKMPRSPKQEPKVTSVSTASVSTQPAKQTALDWYNEASQLGRRGKFRNAIKAYSQALTLKPDFADARVGLAAAYGSLGNWSKVIQELEQVVQLTSNQFGTPFNKVQAQYNLTAAYCMTGASGKAKNLLRQVDKADHPHVGNLKNFVDARCP